LDEDSILSFLKYSYISSPNSIYKYIHKLEPGTILEINLEKFHSENEYVKNYKWFDLFKSVKNSKERIINNFDEAKINLEKKLSNAVKKQMISDVPIGSFLSGGIDSSLITAMMQKHSKKKVETFSIKFENSEYDESKYAKKVSQELNTNHNELLVSQKNVLDTIENMNNTFGEPFGDSSQVPMYLLSKFTKEKVTVSLSGDGADELFCGYSRYKYINTAWKIYKILNLKNKSNYMLLNKIPLKFLNKLINILSFSKIAQLDDKISKFRSSTKNIAGPNDIYFKLISNLEY
jgi:Asparagine synthase (glutamine-hydrolyzing)